MSAVVLAPKQNNFLQTTNVIQQIKYLIIFETLLGINRLYLCGYRKCVLWLSYIYDVILVLGIATFIFYDDLYTVSQHFYKNVTGVEYLLLGLSALLIQNKQIRKLFSGLQTIDEKLNIGNEVSLLSPKHWYIYGIGAALLYNIIENIFSVVFLFNFTDMSVSFIVYLIYLPIIAHDIEIVFFCYLLGSIFTRLYVIKAHVAKVLSVDIEDRPDIENSEKIEALAKRVNIDVGSVHELYDLLHKCSEKLNCLMSLSMIVMIITSGLSTIMILKNTIAAVQNTDDAYPYSIKWIVISSTARCLKYIFILIFPCYISHKTKSEVATIRTMIYDTLNSIQLDKIERRKLKAFFHLVRENEFAYALFGVVNLDMSLPLSYSSLCTTYLIIVVQFYKFFD